MSEAVTVTLTVETARGNFTHTLDAHAMAALKPAAWSDLVKARFEDLLREAGR